MTGTNATSDAIGLDHVSALAFGKAVQLGRFHDQEIAHELGVSLEEAARARQLLGNLLLLHPAPDGSGDLIPVSPDTAVAELVAPVENQVRVLQRAIGGIRSRLESLKPVYFEGRRQSQEVDTLDAIADGDKVPFLFEENVRLCRSELLIIQPGEAHLQQHLRAIREPVLAALRRGVRVQGLYQHAACTNVATQSLMHELFASGVEIHTDAEVADGMMIFDREVALLSSRCEGALVVRGATAVSYFSSVFEHLWHRGVPFEPGKEQERQVVDDVKLAILALLAKGYKDEMVARRLDISVRTCRERIKELMAELNAVSRFQAGVNAARSGVLDERRGA
ncbi:hypothetical protein [Streptomyces sp. NPDC001530]|uniref:hypothetical protein n=1 Tax=Streptomyces sp. NPDC001530 TaxID=3364582 RepID=UPI0036B9D1F0